MAHIKNAALRGPSWESRGYCGQGNVDVLIDTLLGRTALVCGSGRGVFEDFDRVYDGSQVVFAANDVGMYLPHIDHFVSLHTTKLDHWVAIRRDDSSKGIGNKDFHVHDGGLYGPRDWYQWEALTPTMALSGLFAAQIAYLMGCERIVLVGCPNDSTPRFFEREGRNGAYVNVQRQVTQEMAYKPDFKAAVRSVSGWSKEFFGDA